MQRGEMRMMRSMIWLMLAATASACPAGTVGDAERAKVDSVPVFNPAKTSVVVLPVVNQTGKRGEEMDNAVLAGVEIITEALSARGFQIVAPDKVTDCLAKRKIDLADEESTGKAPLTGIGKAVGADLLVACSLQDLDSRMNEGFFARKVGRAKVRLKVLDVSAETYLLNDVFEGKKRGSAVAPVLSKSKGLRSAALDDAIQKGLADFLKPYKPVPKPPQTEGEKTEQK
jgi:hypothetical protein